jgi:diketogulonate reductase-like aldo/keto reductase
LARRHRQRVEPAFEASLDRLALNYWDLYLIHYSIGKTLVEVFGLGGTAWHGSAYNA